MIYTVCEKCPNTEFFLVRIFPHLDWTRTRKNSIFGHFSRSDSFMHYRTAGYFHYFVVCIVVLYAFEFSYGEIMIRFLISHAFYGGGLVRKRCLLECSAYSDLSLKSFCVYLRAIALVRRSKAYEKFRCLFKARRLLEEVRLLARLLV